MRIISPRLVIPLEHGANLAVVLRHRLDNRRRVEHDIASIIRKTHLKAKAIRQWLIASDNLDDGGLRRRRLKRLQSLKVCRISGRLHIDTTRGDASIDDIHLINRANVTTDHNGVRLRFVKLVLAIARHAYNVAFIVAIATYTTTLGTFNGVLAPGPERNRWMLREVRWAAGVDVNPLLLAATLNPKVAESVSVRTSSEIILLTDASTLEHA